MFTEEQLKALGIDDDKIAAVLAKQTEIINDGSGQWIPQHRFSEVVQERDTARSQVTERDTQIADLKKFEGDQTALQARITELETENSTIATQHANELKALQQSNNLRNWLMENGEHVPQNANIVMGLLDMESITFDDQNMPIKGHDDQLKGIAEKDAYLFVPKDNSDPKNPSGQNAGFKFVGRKPEQGGQPQDPETATSFAQRLAQNKLKSMGVDTSNNTPKGGN